MTTRAPSAATPARLLSLAAGLTASTKAAAAAALKAAGVPQAPNVDALLAALASIQRARRTAKLDRIARRIGRPLDRLPQPTGRAPVRLKPGTPADRLTAARRAAIHDTFGSTYRTATRCTVRVHLTTDPTAVSVQQLEGQDWDVYRGAHKGRPARTETTTLAAPADWRPRVQRRGLAVVDGMMTLDAAPLESTGCELFAARWIEQGRGTSVALRQGYIARAAGHTYHATTIDQALSGIARKARAAAIAAALAAADLDQLTQQHAQAPVRIADARAAGACEYGIRSWCAAVGLDYTAGAAPLAQVYAAYRRQPRPEARATILRVLRARRAIAA